MNTRHRERVAALQLPWALLTDAWWFSPTQPAVVVVALDDYRQRPEEKATRRWPR